MDVPRAELLRAADRDARHGLRRARLRVDDVDVERLAPDELGQEPQGHRRARTRGNDDRRSARERPDERAGHTPRRRTVAWRSVWAAGIWLPNCSKNL